MLAPVNAEPAPAISASATSCLADLPPNEQPSNSQTVPPEFCIAGAVGQHYYFWSIPASDAGRVWTLKLQALPSENTILMVQTLDRDPHKGPFNFKTIWRGASTPASANIATPPLTLEPGLYGIVAATQQSPGLYRLFVASANESPAAPSPAAVATSATPAVPESSAGVAALSAPAGTASSAPAPAASSVPAAVSSAPAAAASTPVPEAPLQSAVQVAGPSDTPATAFAFSPDLAVTGVLPARNGSYSPQFLSLTLDNSWSDKRFDLVLRANPKTRTESFTVAYVLADGSEGEVRNGAGEARLPRLAFDAGKYVFRVSAVPQTDLLYTLSIENVAPLISGEEREPNDIAALANPLPADGTISGYGDGSRDDDFFRLRISGPPKLWRITCNCKDAEWLTVLAGDGSTLIAARDFPNGQAQISSVLLAAGDHFIRVRSSSGNYVLHVAPQGPAPVEAGGHPAPLDAPLSAIDEIEPNDDLSSAMPIALNSSRGGLNEDGRDHDYYHFTLLNPTHIRLTLVSQGDVGRQLVLDWGADLRDVATLNMPNGAKTPMVWDGVLAAGDYYVAVHASTPSTQPYRVKLEAADPFAVGPTKGTLALDAHLVFDTARVAADAFDAQTLNGHLDLASNASGALDFAVVPYVADERWHVAAGQSAVHLNPGARLSIPITLEVAANAWANHPVQIAFALREKNGTHVTASTWISPNASAPEIAPSASWEIPSQLAGGLNFAWSALGGRSLDNHPQLIDGLSNAGGTLKLKTNDAKAGLGIALAGSGPAHLVGFAFVPAGSAPAGDRMHHFQVLGSADGTHFTTIFNGTLSPRDDTRYFVLHKPTDARVLKLLPLDAQDPQASTIALGEFEAIADPATAPLGPAGLEISPILRGGHVVWIDPYVDTQAMFSAAAARSSLDSWSSDRKEPLYWVVGFLDDRPARIDSIAWNYASDEPAGHAGYEIPSVEVFGSLASPLGPWTDLGVWRISPTGDSAPFRPKGQPPFRYLRFVAAATKYHYGADLPLHLSIREIAIDKTYRSVLALPMRAPAPPVTGASAGSAPQVLALNKPVHGTVQLGTRTDRWLLDLPDGTRNVTLTLANAPAIGATLILKTANGAAVPFNEETPDSATRRYTASVDGGRYEVKIAQPPRSIALLWDTSSSVGGWLPAITAAVRSITQDASPGRDEINLFPFHDPIAQPLLKSYSGDSAALFAALQAYDWKDSSSSAEGALIGASQTLESRPGSRGIIMLTDAETTSLSLTPQLWQLLAKVRPQIFTLSVPTTSTGEDAWKSRNLMIDWAVATGGFNMMVGDQGNVEAAFQRAAAALRGRAPYTLTASVSTAPPAPGKLAVTFAPHALSAKPLPRQAVALVLDASGSMLQKINRQKKIDIARNELDHLVRQVIPDGTPIALRVYGQGGRGSCRSDLMMPLAPLDRAKAESVVATVRSTDGAKTATAASLHATAQDLAAAQGAKRVILITDGGENCGGDVETEIAALRKSGFDLQLNIVGFAIDSPQTGKMFTHWAELGGGKYFESKDASTLDSAMKQAVQQQFEAVDGKGAVVATGDVGGAAIAVPPGHYTVRLRGQPGISVQADVKPNTTASAVLPQ